MSAVNTPQPSGGKKKGKKRRRPPGFSLDMTPMVDVAFLLLTFFMLTTTFSKPNTMELNLPPEEKNIKIALSNIMNIRIVEGNKLYWAMGEEAPKPTKIENNEFRKLVEQQADERRRQGAELVVIIKLDKKAKYRNLVDVIDELQVSKMNRFSLAPFTTADSLKITGDSTAATPTTAL